MADGASEEVRVVHAEIARHADAVQRLFAGGVKVTVFVRTPAAPDGSQDALVSDDDPIEAAACIERLYRSCPPAVRPAGLVVAQAPAPEADDVAIVAAEIVRYARESRSAMAAEWVVGVRLKRLLARAGVAL